VTVSEDEIVESIALLAERGKIIWDGSAAVTFAAVFKKKFNFPKDEKVVSVTSGGNIELQLLSG
jgi:threonine dehydratase